MSASDFDGEKFRTERMNISPDLRRLRSPAQDPGPAPGILVHRDNDHTAVSPNMLSLPHIYTIYIFLFFRIIIA